MPEKLIEIHVSPIGVMAIELDSSTGDRENRALDLYRLIKPIIQKIDDALKRAGSPLSGNNRDENSQGD